MYKQANSKLVSELNKWCTDVLHDVQRDIKSYFTFDIRLIGSGEKRLVLQNGNGTFDLDYNLIIKKDKQDMINNPEQIKNIFIDSFNNVLQGYINNFQKFDKRSVKNSTSVITVNLENNNKVVFSFDVAILVECDNGFTYRLIYDKKSHRYIWNVIRGSKDYYHRFAQIKNNGQFTQFKSRYIELKNMHLQRNDDRKSFSVFLETLNEFR